MNPKNRGRKYRISHPEHGEVIRTHSDLHKVPRAIDGKIREVFGVADTDTEPAEEVTEQKVLDLMEEAMEETDPDLLPYTEFEVDFVILEEGQQAEYGEFADMEDEKLIDPQQIQPHFNLKDEANMELINE